MRTTPGLLHPAPSGCVGLSQESPTRRPRPRPPGRRDRAVHDGQCRGRGRSSWSSPARPFAPPPGALAIGAGLYFRIRQGQRSWCGRGASALDPVGRERAARGDELRGFQLCDQVRGAAGLRLDQVGDRLPRALGGECGCHADGRGVRMHHRKTARRSTISTPSLTWRSTADPCGGRADRQVPDLVRAAHPVAAPRSYFVMTPEWVALRNFRDRMDRAARRGAG